VHSFQEYEEDSCDPTRIQSLKEQTAFEATLKLVNIYVVTSGNVLHGTHSVNYNGPADR